MGTIRKRRQGLPAANSRHSGRAGAARRAGFTIVEVMVAVVVLVIAIVGIVGSMLSAMALNRVNRETAIAQQAARRAIEEVTSVRYRDVYVVFNQEAGDDAASETPERGPSFLVNNLQPQNGDADGMCGRIEFPEIDVGGGNFMLDESFVDAALGMPRELNGNLNPNETLDAGYRVLPLRVWVEWAGVSGNRSIRFETMLSQR